MTLRIARWFNGQWYMNPFDLTYEQINKLSVLSDKVTVDRSSVKLWTDYVWGYVFEEDFFEGRFHEIMVHYACPSSYGRQKQIEWLKKHNYPFEIS